MKGKCIAKGKNKKGFIYALLHMNTGLWEVWALCENYNGKVKGGIRKTWRYCDKGMSESDARHLYSKKLNGRS